MAVAAKHRITPAGEWLLDNVYRIEERIRTARRHPPKGYSQEQPGLALPLTWIEQQLAEAGLGIGQLVRAGNQRQAADQVSISNSIGSLRALGAMDWREFFEAMCVVERILRADRRVWWRCGRDSGV